MAETLDLSGAMASLSEKLHTQFTTLNDNPPRTEFPFAWLSDLMSSFQATFPVHVLLILTFGRVGNGHTAIQWKWPLENEGSGAFMRSLTKVGVDELTQDTNRCAICKVKFAISAGPQVGTDATENDEVLAEQSVNTQEGVDVEQEIPEIPLKLACGHILGESCIQSWISERVGRTQPTCPICRAAIPGIGDIEVPEIAMVVKLDELRGLALLFGINAARD